MEIFGKKYSRENFEEAEEKAESARMNNLRASRYGVPEEELGEERKMEIENMSEDEKKAIVSSLFDGVEKAEKRVEGLFAKGKNEAEILNKTHEELKNDARRALERLVRFERDSLDMHQEKEGEMRQVSA